MEFTEPKEKKLKVEMSQDEINAEIEAGLFSKTMTDELLSALCLGIVERAGSAALQAYTAKDKHKHKLIHLLVTKNKVASITALAQYLNINEARPNDQCTPLHLSTWTKNPELTELLLDLGADATLKNKYGESTEELKKVVLQRTNMAFIDLELTDLPSAKGLDGQGPMILEIALIITDKDLNEIERGHWLVNPGPEALASLSEFGKKTFAVREEGGNGLLKDVAASGVPTEEAQQQLMEMLKRHCPKTACPLAGSSVHCDREVLKERMREVYDHMSHQIVDVSTVLQLCGRWGGLLSGLWQQQQKEESNVADTTAGGEHRAMWDIERSIHTLRYARQHAFVSPPAKAAEGGKKE